MERHPRGDQNREYLCVQTSINAHLGTHEAGSAQAEFNCSFSAMPSVQQFRPLRRTPKPVMQGPQTAVVVGPAGEEIYTDKYGRVKVQFHWDRKGQRNDTSSCWLRVSSPWAGKSFGFIQIPRIGQEVVVDFLEGDPDQPLVTGRVYNAEQMPPWDLPANATQSGVLTRSSKGGGYLNANGLRFEDKKGSEQVWFHAEKDMSISVENDESRTVGHDETSLIQHHQKINVKKGREVYVEEDGETYYVKGLRKIFIKGHQEQVVTDGSDTFVTNKRGEYTTGDHIVLTTGKHVFKSTEAYINAGPLHFTTATDVKTLATASVALQAGTEFSAKAASFKFSATGNFDFTGNQFNRTIFEGNDTVLGANTNTYIGVSRDVAMGPATEVYSGLHNSTAAGIAVEGFLGMQVSNFIGLSISNAVALSIANSGINMGITGIDLTLAGIGLDNNGFKMLNGGAGSGAGGASMSSGATQIAALFAGIGLLGGAADGIAGAVSAQSKANADIDKLLNDPSLTPEVRARLRNAMSSRFTNSLSTDAYTGSIPQAEIDAQTASLAKGTPDAAPANDPTAGLASPAAPGDPTAAPAAN
jgi:type VI secretion system secreted protein VgrG